MYNFNGVLGCIVSTDPDRVSVFLTVPFSVNKPLDLSLSVVGQYQHNIHLLQAKVLHDTTDRSIYSSNLELIRRD